MQVRKKPARDASRVDTRDPPSDKDPPKSTTTEAENNEIKRLTETAVRRKQSVDRPKKKNEDDIDFVRNRELEKPDRMNAVIERAERRDKSIQEKETCNVPSAIFPDIESPWHESKKTTANDNGGNVIMDGKPFWLRAPTITAEEMDTITSDDLPMTAEVFIDISSGLIVLPIKSQKRRFKFDPYANIETLAMRDVELFDSRVLFSNTIRNLMMGASQAGVVTATKTIASEPMRATKKDDVQIMPPPETFVEYTRGVLLPPEKAFLKKPYVRSNKVIEGAKPPKS